MLASVNVGSGMFNSLDIKYAFYSLCYKSLGPFRDGTSFSCSQCSAAQMADRKRRKGTRNTFSCSAVGFWIFIKSEQLKAGLPFEFLKLVKF